MHRCSRFLKTRRAEIKTTCELCYSKLLLTLGFIVNRNLLIHKLLRMKELNSYVVLKLAVVSKTCINLISRSLLTGHPDCRC